MFRFLLFDFSCFRTSKTHALLAVYCRHQVSCLYVSATPRGSEAHFIHNSSITWSRRPQRRRKLGRVRLDWKPG